MSNGKNNKGGDNIMIKKIIISIIVMMFFSVSVYGANIIVSENINNTSPNEETVIEEEKENEGTEEKSEDIISNTEITNISEEDDLKEIVKQQETTSIQVVNKSNEARLKNIKVNVEGLAPKFDKDILEYYLNVDLSVNQIKITAETLDSKAIYSVSGNKNLKKGDNTVTIQVTAEDGTKETYYIYVTKVEDLESVNAELETLEIKGFDLSPSFKSDIYNYKLDINEYIKKINIKATPHNENASVEIEGNTDLNYGENTIKINVTAEDKKTVKTYTIETIVNADEVEIKEEDKTPAIILLIIFGIGILISGTIIIVKNKK